MVNNTTQMTTHKCYARSFLSTLYANIEFFNQCTITNYTYQNKLNAWISEPIHNLK